MNALPDLNKYWGVILQSLALDTAEMSATLSLFWTEGSTRHTATLTFVGVTHFEVGAERYFQSELVELISLEAHRQGNLIEVDGELSNYEFAITCMEIQEFMQS